MAKSPTAKLADGSRRLRSVRRYRHVARRLGCHAAHATWVSVLVAFPLKIGGDDMLDELLDPGLADENTVLATG
ncbi:MAG: hypothetical protein H6971_05045 [Gammaproteobacteria bacterium]|nr:hypothetical protein [Gammaproteobacteria bacterium]